MLKSLELNMSFIIALAVVSQVMSLTFFRVWGRFSDRFSNKSVLQVSGPLFIGCILAWTFTTMPERYFLTIPLLIVIHILTGISTAGVIDPAKVVRATIQNASSIANLILTTEALVADMSEEKQSMPAMPPGGVMY